MYVDILESAFSFWPAFCQIFLYDHARRKYCHSQRKTYTSLDAIFETD